jgi:hypothetical protein
LLHNLLPLLIGRTSGFATKNELRRTCRKVQTLKLGQGESKNLVWCVQLCDGIGDTLRPKVRRKRKGQHGQPAFIDLCFG